MSEADWHGWWVRGRGAIHVGHLPGRKSACLYVVHAHDKGGSSIETLSFFPSEEKAREALGWLDALVRSQGAA